MIGSGWFFFFFTPLYFNRKRMIFQPNRFRLWVENQRKIFDLRGFFFFSRTFLHVTSSRFGHWGYGIKGGCKKTGQHGKEGKPRGGRWWEKGLNKRRGEFKFFFKIFKFFKFFDFVRKSANIRDMKETEFGIRTETKKTSKIWHIEVVDIDSTNRL